MIKHLAFLAAGTLLTSAASAQTQSSPVTPFALNTTNYSQNFNTLAQTGNSNTLPTGWQISETGTSGTVDGQYAAGTGSSNAGNAYSFGAAGSSDRALGGLFSGSNSPSFGAVFTNQLGAAITSLSFDFFGEQWRAGDATSDRLVFEYLVGGTSILGSTGWTAFTPLDVVSLVNDPATPGALDGNLTANRARYTSLLNLNVAAGQNFAIRWRDTDGAGGADHGLAIDDLSFTARLAQVGAVPEPATWGLMLLGFGLVGGLSRRRQRKVRAAIA